MNKLFKPLVVAVIIMSILKLLAISQTPQISNEIPTTSPVNSDTLAKNPASTTTSPTPNSDSKILLQAAVESIKDACDTIRKKPDSKNTLENAVVITASKYNTTGDELVDFMSQAQSNEKSPEYLEINKAIDTYCKGISLSIK